MTIKSCTIFDFLNTLLKTSNLVYLYKVENGYPIVFFLLVYVLLLIGKHVLSK